MATTKKTTTPKTEDVEASTKTNTSEVSNEFEDMQRKLKEAEEKIAKMMEVIEASKTSVVVDDKPVKSRNIKFVNLTNGTIVMRGAGNSFKEIEGLYSSRQFTEREAQTIIANNPNLIRSGLVYIADARFVRENDLEDDYATFLSVEQMKELFSRDANYIIEAYENTSDEQKNAIIDIVVEKRLNGEEIDANILLALGKASGRDLISIEPEK